MAGRKISSKTWKYFTSQGNKTATCNMCQKSFSYRTSITNLKTHLKLKHEAEFYDLEQDSHDNDSNAMRPLPAVGSELPSSIWHYFSKSSLGDKDTKGDIAICLLCRKEHTYYSNNTSNLKQHLRRRHLAEYEIFWNNNVEEIPEMYSSKATTVREYHDVDPARRQRRHLLWKYFSKCSRSNKTAQCNMCHKKLSYRTTITNLKTHLNLRHSSEYKEYLEKCNGEEGDVDDTSTTIVVGPAFTDKTENTEYVEILINNEGASGSTDPLSPYSLEQHIFDEQIDETWSPTTSDHSAALKPATSNKRKGSNIIIHQPLKREKIDATSAATTILNVLPANENKLIDGMLLKLFIRTYQPFSIIEEEDFIDFVKALNPSYNLPDMKQVTDQLIPYVYDKCLEEQKQAVREQAKYVCLTTDTWTSSTMDAFLTATIHFLTEELDMKSVMLTCSLLKGPHTVSNLVSELKNIAEEWGIADKILICVTNNDSNIVSAVKLLGWTHYQCYVNNLNLIVNKALDICHETIDKVKIIVTHFHTSCLAKEKLIEYQQFEQGITQPRVPTNCDPRCWISIYSMLGDLITLQEAVQAVMLMPNMDDDLPVVTEEEWSTLKQLCAVLKPFEETARILNAENYVAAGKVIVLTNGLKNVLEKLKNEDFFPKIEEIIDVLSAEIDSRFDDVEFNENLALCTALDPRFKLPAFKNETAAGHIKTTLIDKVKNLIDKERVELNVEVTDSKENIKSDRFSIWNSFKESAKIMNPSQSSTTLAAQEVENFLNDSLLDLDEDPIDWWRERRPLYQHLRTIFMENCHTLANSVPCESLFAGREICERRTRLTTTKINQLVFLNANMKKCDYKRFL